MKWHIGCSGFYNKDWKGVFYPDKLPQRNWFEYYASKFDSLEVNSTFYRFPQLSALQNWYEKSPSLFYFSVKAPRLITHYKQFNDCAELLNDFYSTVKSGLKEKLGAILFQMPPKWNYTSERLELLINNLQTDVNNVVEFRHESWWNKDVYDRLKKENIIFTGISHPQLPETAIANNKIIYYRFHGIPNIYYSQYDNKALKKIANEILKNKTATKAYIFFNNTATMAAINNAVWFKEFVESK